MADQIFISYRRQGGATEAKLICEALKNKGNISAITTNEAPSDTKQIIHKYNAKGENYAF